MRITPFHIEKAIKILEDYKPKPIEQEWILFLTKKERQIIINNLRLAIRCHKSVWHDTIAEVKDIENILESLGRIA